jgi:5-oxoprolinase (ATP-hydrolysing) subunit C
MNQIEVIRGGIQSTVQDYPGRRGMLRQGFFPAGAMDHFALRAANLLVGNSESAAGIEVTLGDFALRFGAPATVAVCGADAELTLGGETAGLWESHPMQEGDELRLGLAVTTGFRMYVAVSGGIDVPPLFGSRSTYTMGALGGLEGRALKEGDRLSLGDAADGAPGRRFKDSARPRYEREWKIETLAGPQAAPDFLTEEDVRTFFDRTWKVDRNSDRTGIRLESHRFQWARDTGGVAGGHPSNILDNPYPVGAVNINGDLPVILGPDGPTAGGFVVAATLTHADSWKIGQLRPVGDRLRFVQVNAEQAAEREREQRDLLSEASLEDL